MCQSNAAPVQHGSLGKTRNCKQRRRLGLNRSQVQILSPCNGPAILSWRFSTVAIGSIALVDALRRSPGGQIQGSTAVRLCRRESAIKINRRWARRSASLAQIRCAHMKTTTRRGGTSRSVGAFGRSAVRLGVSILSPAAYRANIHTL